MSLRGLKTYGRSGALLALLALFWASPAAAFQFTLGEVQGSLDSTLSYGLSWRVADQDKEIVGSDAMAGGKPVNAYSRNSDDGNLNYDKGDLVSNTAKLTSELALNYQNFGLFLRGTAFYDFENNDGDRERTPLSDDALDLVGKDAKLLDAYLWWSFDLNGTPGQLRVGDQVLSWGESTFLQNGINVINPFDVSALRVPGAELKEGLTPVGMVTASISPTENVTFEAFYQYDWEAVEVDPAGSYWSSNDSIGAGGEKVMLGFGRLSDLGESWSAGAQVDGLVALLQSYGYPPPTVVPPPPPYGPIASTELRNSNTRFNAVPRGTDVYADNDGQYGLAMRVYAPGLNDTEFGFYFMNYHSRLPVISAKTGTQIGALKTSIAKTAATAFGTEMLAGSGDAGLAILAADTAAALVPGAGLLGSEEVSNIAVGAAYAALTGVLTNNPYLAEDYVKDEYTRTAEYFLEYPEDIQLFGVSFNTVLPVSGVALQGEISHRRDMPLQVDDLELLFATLGPISPAPGTLYGASNLNQLANVQDPTQFSSPYEQTIHGYKRLDMTQVQTTATKLFGPAMGADQFTMVGEVGITHVHNMPSKDKLRFEGPGTPISGNASLASSHYNEIEPSRAFADATSWGYRLVGKLDFNNAIGAVTLSPRIAWAHDVDGTTPAPGGNFVDGRKAITFGIGADYQNTWSADLSYTDFFGAGRYNLINDRDFVSLNIKYSF